MALVVTSPPYFAGKEYERELLAPGGPVTYLEYLTMLEAVLAEAVRVLEPGGRIAINIANLGRRPYRSLAADVITILQDRLGLLLRGEFIWVKGRGARGSVAWGSFMSPTNPVIRDVSERVIVASKGRFDRAVQPQRRAEMGLPHALAVSKDEFMAATTDVWELPAESATRVGHPAPFPVDLPLRLIELYTFVGDVVLDPFMGSGSTAVAAVRSGRHFIGYDTEPTYVDLARRRIEEESLASPTPPSSLGISSRYVTPGSDISYVQKLAGTGSSVRELGRLLLSECGFTGIEERVKIGRGLVMDYRASDDQGDPWFFDIVGAYALGHEAFRQTEEMWRTIGKAFLVSELIEGIRQVWLVTQLPKKGSAGAFALDRARDSVIEDAVEILSLEGVNRLRALASRDSRR